MKRILSLLSVGALALLLGACATPVRRPVKWRSAAA